MRPEDLYELIAQQFKSELQIATFAGLNAPTPKTLARIGGRIDSIYIMARRLAHVMANDNPHFDADRFYKAAGVQDAH